MRNAVLSTCLDGPGIISRVPINLAGIGPILMDRPQPPANAITSQVMEDAEHGEVAVLIITARPIRNAISGEPMTDTTHIMEVAVHE